ncbi:cysteine-rich receptor-like protein kinase 26 [Triticum aestivum]|uniref:cysteine-rich receptor-like protein kinase 26 n=1 Tax=Triticum aestivum TaxID=4565 RepID=UPI001D028C9A|nr:cysteine-rich receptor-like protein kinase 26 [Triticum aestivum]
MPYPLNKHQMFSRVKGTLALKVYTTDDPHIAASNTLGMINSSNNMESILQDQSSRPHSIPLQHLKEVTNNFSEDRILGHGGIGVVYKGVLHNGEMIAVKKIVSSLMPGPQKQFENEVYHLMIVRNPNIVRCVGYCYEIKNACLEYNGKYIFAEMAERLLCLEYLPKGSLDKYLSDESSGLEWSTRYKIIMGICNGLRHLHLQNDKPIVHLDLKPANIMLDDSMEPKIIDFGLSRLLDKEQTICTSSRDGTFGYMAPEFLHSGTITRKSDIFSLGVIIFEIITGRRDYVDVTPNSSYEFIEDTLKKWRNTLERAPGYRSLEIECQQIKRCIQVALICMNFERAERPRIMKIINMLQGLESIDFDVTNVETSSRLFGSTG